MKRLPAEVTDEICPREKNMNAPITIRAAKAKDSAVLADLLDQLGYPASASKVAERFGRLAEMASEKMLVAERNGNVIGLISVHLTMLLHTDANLCRITSLAVDQAARRQGVGRMLIQAAERWAWSRDCAVIELTSSDHRTEAHRFYAACGYQCIGKRFLKDRPGR